MFNKAAIAPPKQITLKRVSCMEPSVSMRIFFSFSIILKIKICPQHVQTQYRLLEQSLLITTKNNITRVRYYVICTTFFHF